MTMLSRVATLAAVAVCMLTVAAPSGAWAQSDAAPSLGIAPVGQDGAWFDVELEPGAVTELEVELANHGEQEVVVRTYAADAYTLVNGGMGVETTDETTDSIATWLDYPDTTTPLPPDGAIRRTFTVTVPADAQPGQYLAAVVIENDAPYREDRDEYSLNHIVRQALAVNITVPGPAAPAFAIGDTEHLTVGAQSVVSVGLDNTGNRHLKPAGTLTVTDAAGALVAEHEVTLDTIYAATATTLEMPLDKALAPGAYTVELHLADPNHGIDETGHGQVEVVAPPAEGSAVPGLDAVRDRLHGASQALPPHTLPASATAAVLLLVLLTVAWRRRRGRRDKPQAERQPAPPAQTPVPVVMAPPPPAPVVMAPPPPAPVRRQSSPDQQPVPAPRSSPGTAKVSAPSPRPASRPEPDSGPHRRPVPAARPAINTSSFTAQGGSSRGRRRHR